MSGNMSRRAFLGFSGALVVGAGLGGSLVHPASALALPPPGLLDEDGYDLWLRYRLVDDTALRQAYTTRLGALLVQGDGPSLGAARTELVRGLTGLLGQAPAAVDAPARPGTVVVGTPSGSPVVRDQVAASLLDRAGPEGYVLASRTVSGVPCVVVASRSDVGALRGTFHLLRLVQTRRAVDDLAVVERPANELRMINHWDNLNRTVERGYAGASIFDWDALPDLDPRYTDYARTLASVGVNGTVVNNVNADPAFLDTDFVPKLAALAGVLRPYGVKLFISAYFDSPKSLGGLPTGDPLDAAVRQWWADKADEIYAAIPDFGGWLVKGSSEGQPGPVEYGRSHADGANALAAALAPHDGTLVYRAFVHGGVSTWTEDAWHEFTPFDGKFADNVVVQIKNGPMDFNPLEPVNPLLGGMPHTNSMIELQITQEYTGHATHLCYLVPDWKQVLDFDTRVKGDGPTVREIVGGSAFGYGHSGFAGVVNFGTDRDWTGHQLAAANTHGYARLAWDPTLSAEEIADEWTTMTFGADPRLRDTLNAMLLRSWHDYRDYTEVLGQGYLVNGLGDHLAPDLVASHAWHQSDHDGTGFDRTVATGTGYAGFYSPAVTALYEQLETCPDELLLFFHHVPYTHRLHSGSTVIADVYDRHFRGLIEARTLRNSWRSLSNLVDDARYDAVAERFDDQVHWATVWRDAVVGYFFQQSRLLAGDHRWVQVALPASSGLLLGGWPNPLRVNVGNATDDRLSTTVGLADVPGWQVNPGTVDLASTAFGDSTLRVVPSRTPAITSVTVDVDTRLDVLGATPQPVAVVPAAQLCHVALDAGTSSSPVLSGYTRLSPSTAWNADRGFGWVDGAPQSRDRGGAFDDLRRDFCNDTTERVLRVAVPAGTHTAYLLVGDATVDAKPTYVTIDGDVVALSEALASNEFSWLSFPLDGGTGGGTVDLHLSSVPGEHWHLVSLILPDPDATLPPVVVTDATVDLPMLGGRENTVTVTAVNTTSQSIDVTVEVDGPAGWPAASATATVAAADTAAIPVTVTPPLDPVITTLTVTTTAGSREVGDGVRHLDVIATPSGDAVALALDAGGPDSPVLSGYRRLSPADVWNPASGYGWVGAVPDFRDRNMLDVFRRDLVFGRPPAPTTLRLAIPAGTHRVHILTGDAFAIGSETVVTVDGTVVGRSGDSTIPQGTFRWFHFDLDGGAAGRTVDLELTGNLYENIWRIVGLVVI